MKINFKYNIKKKENKLKKYNYHLIYKTINSKYNN